MNRSSLAPFPAVLLFVWAALSHPPALAEFTVQQILSAPFPSSLTTSSTGSQVAWVFDDQGVDDVWIAEGPKFAAKQLTDFDRDDGRSLSIVGFTADGKFLVFARGNDYNPDHDPDGPTKRALHVVATSGKKDPVRLGDMGGGAISPTENRLAYVEGGAVWTVPIGADGDAVKLVALRGAINQLAWSPDGKRLSVVSTRGEAPYRYSYVAIYDLEAKQLTYADASVFLDNDPAWSPDGTKLAFLRRLTSDHGFVLTARDFPRPDPWEVRVFDLASGETNLAWRAPAHDNFFAADVEWITDDRLVVLSEHTGWRHLYSVPSSGGEPSALTEGEFEVESFTVAPDRGVAVVTCNRDDIDRRHVWVVGPDQPMKQLTPGTGIEWDGIATGDRKYVAHLASDARRPAHVVVRPIEGGEPQTLAPETMPDDFPLDQLVEPKQVMFPAADGLEIHGQLFMPPASFTGPRPAVMFFHGGPIRQMLLGWHYRGYYHKSYGMNQYLASRGYVVLSVNFRLGIGYGRAFRDVPDGGPRGASEYLDLLAGAKFLRAMPEVDPKRIGLWGGSYGGLMTALGLARNSDLFAAGVDLHGVHDWNRWQAWAGQVDNDDDRTVWKSSPVADIDGWRSPVLFIHGDDDRNVDFSETILITQMLTARGVDYELLVFPDDVHSFLLHANWIRAYEATGEFFDRKLKPDNP